MCIPGSTDKSTTKQIPKNTGILKGTSGGLKNNAPVISGGALKTGIVKPVATAAAAPKNNAASDAGEVDYNSGRSLLSSFASRTVAKPKFGD